MKRISLYFLITFMVLLVGCGSEKVIYPKHETFKYINQTIKISKSTKTIEISIDSGNLKIFCWNKKEIKCDAKHIIRDNRADEDLKELLEKYTIESKEENNKLLLTISYNDKIENVQDNLTELELTIPRTIRNLNIYQEFGDLKIEDVFEGNINAQLNSVNTEIGNIKGQINLKCNKGNIRINAGEIYNASIININAGNIYVKSECQSNSNYSFKTGAGNVELNFPVNSNILLNSFGVVNNNQFTGISGDIHVEASTKMGKISVNGY